MDLNFASSQKDKFEKANVCVYVYQICNEDRPMYIHIHKY